MEKLRNFYHTYPHIKYCLFFPIYLVIYFVAEAVITENYWVSYLPLDDHIPFLEGFVVFYDLWYPAMILIGVYLLLKEPEQFKRYMIFLFAGFFLCEVIWILFPNGQNLRPEVFPRDNIFTHLIAGLYAADTNTNVFPSAHVVGAIAVVEGVFNSCTLKKKRILKVSTAVLCFFIAMSTVFIKQHSILDVFGGILLCLPLHSIVYRRAPQSQLQEIPTK